MRFAFWRRREDKAVPAESVSAMVPEFHEPKFRATDPAPLEPAPRRQTIRETLSIAESGDLDLRVIGRTLMRRKWWVILPTLLALGGSVLAVNLITPRYKSESRILIDGRENIFLRPNADRAEDRTSLDPDSRFRLG